MNQAGGFTRLASPMNTRRHLLYVVGQLGAGGLERQLYYLLWGIDRTKYKPAIAIWNFREDEVYVEGLRNLGVSIYEFSPDAPTLEKLWRLSRIIRELRPEIVHSYSFYLNFAVWSATLGTRSIPVGSVRSDFSYARRESGRLLGRLSGRWPRRQIFNSVSAVEASSLRSRLFAPAQAFVVRNSVDLQSFSHTRLAARKPPKIAAIGSLLPIKRWDRLIAIAADLKQRGCEFVLEIAGGGPLRQDLQEKISNSNVTDRVNLAGHVTDIPTFLTDASVLVHTSDSEGCPNSIVEAMAAGRAVVASNVGDIRFLVEHGRTGFIVSPDDHAAFVACVSQLLRNPDLCIRMGEAGRQKAEREFGMARLIEQTFAVYRACGWSNGSGGDRQTDRLLPAQVGPSRASADRHN
jgi:glycosyltransferase involved in cell wall biosynthesis